MVAALVSLCCVLRHLCEVSTIARDPKAWKPKRPKEEKSHECAEVGLPIVTCFCQAQPLFAVSCSRNAALVWRCPKPILRSTKRNLRKKGNRRSTVTVHCSVTGSCHLSVKLPSMQDLVRLVKEKKEQEKCCFILARNLCCVTSRYHAILSFHESCAI